MSISRRTLFKTAALTSAAKPLQAVIKSPPEEWQPLGDPLVSVMRKLKDKMIEPRNAPKYIFPARVLDVDDDEYETYYDDIITK
jgi:hypothetical protein